MLTDLILSLQPRWWHWLMKVLGFKPQILTDWGMAQYSCPCCPCEPSEDYEDEDALR